MKWRLKYKPTETHKEVISQFVFQIYTDIKSSIFFGLQSRLAFFIFIIILNDLQINMKEPDLKNYIVYYLRAKCGQISQLFFPRILGKLMLMKMRLFVNRIIGLKCLHFNTSPCEHISVPQARIQKKNHIIHYKSLFHNRNTVKILILTTYQPDTHLLCLIQYKYLTIEPLLEHIMAPKLFILGKLHNYFLSTKCN